MRGCAGGLAAAINAGGREERESEWDYNPSVKHWEI